MELKLSGYWLHARIYHREERVEKEAKLFTPLVQGFEKFLLFFNRQGFILRGRLNNPVSVTCVQRLNRVTSLIYRSQPIWTR